MLGCAETAVKENGRLAPWRRYGVPLSLAVVTLAFYGRCLSFGYTNWDDILLLRDWLRDGFGGGNLARIFTPGALPGESLYIPLTYLTYLAEQVCFGSSANARHGVNVLLHAANVVMIHAVTVRLTRRRWAGGLTALLFAVHPVQVEAVAWMFGRKDLLSALLALLMVWFYLADQARPSRRYWVGVFLGYVLALLAKPTVLLLPVLLPVLDLYAGKRPGKAWVSRWWPLAPAAVVVLVLNFAGEGATATTGDPYRWLQILPAVSGWLGRLLLAAPCLPLYARPGYEVWQPYFCGLAATVLLVYGCVLAMRRRIRTVLLGVSWFVLLMAPGVKVVLSHREFFTADRYGYLACAGLFLMVGVGMEWLAGRHRGWRWAGMAVVAASAVAAWPAMGAWRNGTLLWERCRRLADDTGVATFQLAQCYYEEGRLEESAALLRETVRDFPFSSYARCLLAEASAGQGRWLETRREAQFALMLDPSLRRALLPLAEAEVALQKPRHALARLARLDSPRAATAQAAYLEGAALLQVGQDMDAVRFFALALRLRPPDMRARLPVLQVLARHEQWQLLIRMLEETESLALPLGADELVLAVRAYLRTGQVDEARTMLGRLREEHPADPRTETLDGELGNRPQME